MDKDSAHFPIVICGSIPPPVGGVTIHTQRLVNLLRPLDGFYFCDIRPRNASGKLRFDRYLKAVFKCAKAATDGVIHYQSNNWWEACALVAMKDIFRYRMVYTLHSFRYDDFGAIKKQIVRFCQKRIECFIAPSSATKTSFIQSNNEMKAKTAILDTYIPQYDIPESAIPQEIQTFSETHANIVLASAWSLYLDKAGVDVYGLDMCIEACRQIRDSSFIFCAPTVKDMDYYRQCIERIHEYELEDRFLLYTGTVPLVVLMPLVDAFVRPSSTDSFGISVAEALDAGVPAIASDVCTRAEGTVLFKARDHADFISKLQYVLDNKKEMQQMPRKGIEQSARIEAYQELYDRVKHASLRL